MQSRGGKTELLFEYTAKVTQAVVADVESRFGNRDFFLLQFSSGCIETDMTQVGENRRAVNLPKAVFELLGVDANPPGQFLDRGWVRYFSEKDLFRFMNAVHISVAQRNGDPLDFGT